MRSALFLFILLASTTLPLRNASADMGQVHAYGASVSETSQKAIILHNGVEEVLILGTDLKADRQAGILRFIPFPAEPQVSLAPPDVFGTAAALLEKHKLQFLQASKGGAAEGRAVELRLQKKLGAHDMTLVKVNDPAQFRSWVNDYFRKRKLPVRTEYAAAEAIVGDYVKRGIVYFVLDFVEVTEETRFIEPVLYRFASRKLYYPLKTSNTFGGKGRIDLILIVPGTLCTPSLGAYDTCLGFTHFGERLQASTSAEIAPDEIRALYPAAGDFFGGRPVFMQMATYWGDYAFDRDILADVGNAFPHAIGFVQEQRGSPWILPMADILRDLEQRAPGKGAGDRDVRCALPRPDPGPCKGLFVGYFFDPGKEACAGFFHGGCGGVIPFETKAECEALCR